MSITTKVVTITPAYARELLGRNTQNRKISRTNYKTLVRAMVRDEWKLNGEAIKVDENGFILDGQHRLYACIEADKAFETLIVEGLPSDTQDTMDTGKSRSVADVLEIRGEKNTHLLAALIRRVYIYENHGLRQALNTGYDTTNHEVLAYYETNKWIESLTPDARRLATYAKIPASLGGLLVYVLSKIDADDAAFFIEKLITGENLAANHPIYVLRRTLHQLHEDRKGTKGQPYLAAISVKAWNKFRDGETISILRWTPGGANPEEFPTPH